MSIFFLSLHEWGLVIGSFRKYSVNSDVQPGLKVTDIKYYEFPQFEALAKMKCLKASSLIWRIF